MPFDPHYHEAALTRAELDQLPGAVVVEFGSNTCGICGAFTPEVEEELLPLDEVRHIRVEDGRGKPLGRSFRVKLWPSFVLLRDGQVVEQLARPSRWGLHEALSKLNESV